MAGRKRTQIPVEVQRARVIRAGVRIEEAMRRCSAAGHPQTPWWITVHLRKLIDEERAQRLQQL